MAALAHLLSDHVLLAWLALGAVFLVAELMTGSGWLLWPAGSAALVGLTTLVASMSWPVQTGAFAMLTIASTYAGRRWIAGRERSPAIEVNDMRLRLIGQVGRASQTFNDGEGRVFIDGKEWSAEAEPSCAIASGARVEVADIIGGARLRVRSAPEA